MPSVLATSTRVDHLDVYDRHTAPPSARRAQQGFWRTLAQHLAWPRIQRSHRRQHACAVSHRIETPAELLARQYPALYIQACLGV
jgi:hypothetical protein